VIRAIMPEVRHRVENPVGIFDMPLRIYLVSSHVSGAKYEELMSTTATIARTPAPPYYAVIFTSQRTPEGEHGYGNMAQRMTELAAEQPGFLGVESVRGADGFGITISYWESEEAIKAWKAQADHKIAQEGGRRVWYADYQLRLQKWKGNTGNDKGSIRTTLHRAN
jgi:heme-degrading monooxygenase HmoA